MILKLNQLWLKSDVNLGLEITTIAKVTFTKSLSGILGYGPNGSLSPYHQSVARKTFNCIISNKYVTPPNLRNIFDQISKNITRRPNYLATSRRNETREPSSYVEVTVMPTKSWLVRKVPRPENFYTSFSQFAKYALWKVALVRRVNENQLVERLRF